MRFLVSDWIKFYRVWSLTAWLVSSVACVAQENDGPAEIYGQVVAESGRPVSDARVRLLRSSHPGLPSRIESLLGPRYVIVEEAVTGIDGLFAFRGGSSEPCGITVAAPDGRRLRCDWVVPGSRLEMRLEDPQPREVAVFVTGESGGLLRARGATVVAPFPFKFGVSLAPLELGIPTYPGEILRCDDDGSFRISWSSPMVLARWQGIWFEARLADGGNGTSSITLWQRKVEATVRGPQGEVVDEAAVYWSRGMNLIDEGSEHRVVAGADGRVIAVAGESAGRLVVEADGYCPTAVAVPAGRADVSLGDIVLEKGRVRRVSAIPWRVSNVEARALVLHSSPQPFVERLAVSQTAHVMWRDPSAGSRPGVAYIETGKRWVRAGVGADVGAGGSDPSVFQGEDRHAAGVVTDEGGAAAANAWVVIQPASAVPFFESDNFETRAVGVDRSGRYSIDGLGPGAWRMYAFSAHGLSDVIVWGDDGTSGDILQIKLRRVRSMPGVVMGDDGGYAADSVVYAYEIPRYGIRRWGHGFAAVTNSVGEYWLPSSGLSLHVNAWDVQRDLWSKPRIWRHDEARDLPVLRIAPPRIK